MFKKGMNFHLLDLQYCFQYFHDCELENLVFLKPPFLMTHNILSLWSWKLKIYCKWSENGSDTFRFLFLKQGF